MAKKLHTTADYSPRRNSAPSIKHPSLRRLSSTANAGSEKGGALMTDELKEREKGSVDKQVYISWAKDAGGVSVGLSSLGMFVVVECLTVTSKWWLTHWSQSGGSSPLFYLSIYAAVNFSAIFATFCRLLLFIFSGLRASRKMFEHLLDVVMEAPMSFFDT